VLSGEIGIELPLADISETVQFIPDDNGST
jgi:hypothetical protein